MKRFLTVGLLALMTTPALAQSGFFDLTKPYQFRSEIDRLAAVQRAAVIYAIENGAYEPRRYRNYYTTNMHFDDQITNNNQALSIGNWSSISCSGDSYCNADQENEDSVQNAQTNTGNKVKADQVGDDKNVSKGGGYEYVN